jgi:deoxyribonuclease-4
MAINGSKAQGAMPFLGVHISTAGGIYRAPERARKLGCEIMQIFCRNQRTWKTPPLTEEAREKFKANCKEHGIKAVSIHSSYLINPGSHERTIRAKSTTAFCEELGRTSALSVPFYTIHPGSHRGTGESACLQRIARMLDRVLEYEPAPGVTVLLETTAGQGTTVGHRFEHMREILAYTKYPERIAVCFDTCHVFAAGYDIRTPASLQRVLTEFNRIIGIDALRLFHLNDSKADLGARIDRHEHIGKGKIGETGFSALLQHPRFQSSFMILETPGKSAQDRANIKALRRLRR